MGKLKTSLAGLATLIDNVQKNGNDVVDLLTADATNVQKQVERTMGGYEVLATYLKQKALKAKVDLKAWDKDTLKDHFDSEVAGFVKGIEAARVDAIGSFKAWDSHRVIKGGAVLADLDRALLVVADIQAQIDKKRKRLLQSSKFKAKMANYDTELATIAKNAKFTKDNLKLEIEATTASSMKSIEAVKLTAATPISKIVEETRFALKGDLDAIKRAADKPAQLRIAFKRYGEQLKDVRGWLAEADEMEAEGEEGSATAKAPDPKPKLKKIVVKKGSTELGTAVAGDYDRATKVLTVPAVLWKKGSGDPLSLLQQKLSVTADYEKADEGKFASDMKLDKLGGDMKKATFKG